MARRKNEEKTMRILKPKTFDIYKSPYVASYYIVDYVDGMYKRHTVGFSSFNSAREYALELLSKGYTPVDPDILVFLGVKKAREVSP